MSRLFLDFFYAPPDDKYVVLEYDEAHNEIIEYFEYTGLPQQQSTFDKLKDSSLVLGKRLFDITKTTCQYASEKLVDAAAILYFNYYLKADFRQRPLLTNMSSSPYLYQQSYNIPKQMPLYDDYPTFPMRINSMEDFFDMKDYSSDNEQVTELLKIQPEPDIDIDDIDNFPPPPDLIDFSDDLPNELPDNTFPEIVKQLNDEDESETESEIECIGLKQSEESETESDNDTGYESDSESQELNTNIPWIEDDVDGVINELVNESMFSRHNLEYS